MEGKQHNYSSMHKLFTDFVFSSFCSVNILSSYGRPIKTFKNVDSCAITCVSFVNHSEVSANKIISFFAATMTNFACRFWLVIALEMWTYSMRATMRTEHPIHLPYRLKMRRNPIVSHALPTIPIRSISWVWLFLYLHASQTMQLAKFDWTCFNFRFCVAAKKVR